MNIILSDREEKLIDIILEYTEWYIALLIIDDISDNIQKYKNDIRIENTMTLSDIMNAGIGKNFSYLEAEKFKYTFSICDYGSKRIMDDYHYSHYRYYQGVGFWSTFFENNKIDVCFITNLNHGFICDYLLQEMAISFGVRCFNIFYHGFHKIAVFNAGDNKFVQLNFQIDKGDENLKSIAYYAKTLDIDKDVIDNSSLKFRIVYKIGGAFLVRLLLLIKNGAHDIHYYRCSWYSYIKAYFKLKKTLRRNKYLYKKYDENERYVIYFLHLEPEAVITNYGTEVDSQLVAIEMLARSVPEGWKVYVKEHPDTYKLNKFAFEHYIPCAYSFLSPYFYNFISKLENVSLIDYKVPASTIIKNAKAVSTIAGTVAAEAVLQKKPLIIFGNEKLLYNLDKEFIFVKSVKDCEYAFSKIENGFIPVYDKYEEIVDKYLVNADKEGRIKIIQLLKQIL